MLRRHLTAEDKFWLREQGSTGIIDAKENALALKAYEEEYKEDLKEALIDFERTFERPSNYFTLSSKEQWEIDNCLNLLDWYWDSKFLTAEHKKRFNDYYNK